jgi:transcriptional regulator with XRE-family HTH domain
MKLSDLRSAETVHQEDMANDPDYRKEYLRNRFANQVAIEVIRWRTEHNLTQTALAKLLGMRQPNVARLEAGEHTPSLDTLSRLSARLDINFSIDIDPEDGVSLRLYGHSDDLDEAIPVAEEAAALPGGQTFTGASLRRVRASIGGVRMPLALPVAGRAGDDESLESGELDSSRVQDALAALMASLGSRKLSDFQQHMPRLVFIDAIFGHPSERILVTLDSSSEAGFHYTEVTEAFEKNMLTPNEKS